MSVRTARLQGHEGTFERLMRQANAGRLPHAMLFSGPEGIGKRTAAIELARELLAAEDSEDGRIAAHRIDRFAHEGLLVYSDVDPPLPLLREDVLSAENHEQDLLEAYRIL